MLPISLSHATMVEGLALHHHDPFDRLLIAQAMMEDLQLVSSAGIFDMYGVSRLW
ncbi:MAG: hypothetical protein ABSE63_13170 [Thermoguttaceae bacterium]|jgi:PIN domain nuclease of toxin-antitoxin system